MPDKTAESVVEAYLSGILSRARASNSLELEKQPNEHSFKEVRYKAYIFQPL